MWYPLRRVPIRVAVASEARPPLAAQLPSEGHGAVGENRHALGDAPAGLVPPALGPHGDQGLWQTINDQAGERRANGKPQVRRRGLT